MIAASALYAWHCAAAIALLVCALSPITAWAEKRVALVIGNQTYVNLGPLSNPVSDAGSLATLLAANGFDVISCDGHRRGCFDLNREGFLDALETLRDKSGGADFVLVFYTGHGMEGPEGNVLTPIDTSLDCASRAVHRGVLLTRLFDSLKGARNKLVILDACRSDPMPQCRAKGFVPVSFGTLTAPDAESLMLVSSTMPGQTASDGLPGVHSPFARALLYWLEHESGLVFDQVLNHVFKQVIEDTKSSYPQVPEKLTRGVAPEICLSVTRCAGNPQATAFNAEIERLRNENARNQELVAIAAAYLEQVGVVRGVDGRSLSPDEWQRALDGIKEVVQDLIKRKDDAGAGEQAARRLGDGDESEAERIFQEDLALGTRDPAKAAAAARHLAALAQPRNVVKAADYFKQAVQLQPDDPVTWISYGETARDAGHTDEAKLALQQQAVDHAADERELKPG
jgi:hypothetical protein